MHRSFQKIRDVVGQRNDQGATVYVVSCSSADQDHSPVQISVNVPAVAYSQSENQDKADIGNITDDNSSNVNSSETQTPVNVDYDLDDEGEIDTNESDIYTPKPDIIDPETALKMFDKNIKTLHKKERNYTAPERQFYACRFCDKLFGRKSDCIRHEERVEKSQSCVKTDDKNVIEITADENSTQKMRKVRKSELTIGDGGTCIISVPPNTTAPSVNGYFQCPHCEKKLKGSSTFYNHVRIVHEKYRPHVCEVCGKAFGVRSNYANHQIAVHTRKCDDCGSYVAETEPWGEGVTKYTERQILCGNCNKIVLFCSGNKMTSTVRGMTVFKERSKKHASEKQTYACEVCDKLFNHLADCKRHQQKHADGSYNMCDVCGRQFKHFTSLQQHMKIHDASFVPFSCWVCRKKFEQKSSFKQHMRDFHDINADATPETLKAEETVQLLIHGTAHAEDIDSAVI